MQVNISSEVIRLGQFLKFVDVVDAGSDVKALLSSGTVTVNAEVETRRGRQLVRGDDVRVGDQDFQIG